VGEAEAAAPVEAGFDAASCTVPVPAAASDFLAAIDGIQCQALETCCGEDAGQFDVPTCTTDFNAVGGWLGMGTPSTFLGGGRMAYNQQAACECLEQIQAVPCITVASSYLAPMEGACLSAIQGTSTSGEACASSWECAPGLYCSVDLTADPADAAALGTCVPIISIGSNCAVTGRNSNTRDYPCNYVDDNGSPTAYCDTGSNLCTATVGLGQSCPQGSLQCATSLCESTCVGNLDFASSGRCTAFPP